MIDEDKSGLIDVEELLGAAVALGIPFEEENVEALLGTQKINFDAFFARMTSKPTPEDTVDDIMHIFELFDQGSTGTISYTDLQNIARIIGAKEDPQEIQEMLATLDTDGDGELDPVDFYTCLVSGMRVRLEEERRKALQRAGMPSEMAGAGMGAMPGGMGGAGGMGGGTPGMAAAGGMGGGHMTMPTGGR